MTVLVSIEWVLRFAVDVLCIFLALMPSIILNNAPLPYVRGFHCNDMTLKARNRASTVTGGDWVAINFLPTVIFGIGEIFTSTYHFDQTFYKLATTYLFGAFTSNSMTHLAKFYIGHLRPHFLDVCDLTPCSGWIQNPSCNADDPRDVTSSRLSFYSFLSSHTMYSMVFTAIYVQTRMKSNARWMRLVRPAIQANLIVIAMSVGYSRVKDNKNHLNDVLLGLLQGAIVAFLIVRYIFPDVFERPKDAVMSDEELEHERTSQVP